MRALLSLLLLSCASSPSAASGGLWCDVDDDQVMISINSGITRGMGSPLFNFEATIELKEERIAPDLRRTIHRDATQYWLDGEALNLLVYWEREEDGEFASVAATIMTKYADDTYEGEYAIMVHGGSPSDVDGEPLRYAGPISCGVE